MTILNIEEAADLLKMSKRSLETLVRGGKLPATQVIGKWIFSKQQLIEYVEKLSEMNVQDAMVEPVTPSKRKRRRNPGYDGHVG